MLGTNNGNLISIKKYPLLAFFIAYNMQYTNYDFLSSREALKAKIYKVPF